MADGMPLFRTACALCFLAACGEQIGVQRFEKQIVVDRREIDFGEVQVNAVSQISVTVKNDGEKEVTIQELRKGDMWSDDFSFSIDGYSIPTQGQRRILIIYQPRDEGEDRAELVIVSDAENLPEFTLVLSGRGV